MSPINVSNANIVVEIRPVDRQMRHTQWQRMHPLHAVDRERRAAEQELRHQIEQVRQKLDRLVCSSVWAEDCLYRGAEYVPDFRCSCALCRSEFPQRRYPRQARQSDISVECQVETDEDPELAEDLARLRNDRVRLGSVFIATGRDDRVARGLRRIRGG